MPLKELVMQVRGSVFCASRPLRQSAAALLVILGIASIGYAQAEDDQPKPAEPAPASSPPVGTEDDAQRGNPVYSDLPASLLLTQDTKTIDGGPVPEQLLWRFIQLHSALDYPAAAEAALQLIDAAADRPIAHYNLACVMAKLNRPEAALAALNRAVDCGWRALAHMRIDPDLATLHETPDFQRLIERLSAKIAEERITPAPLRTDGDLSQIIADLDARVPQLLQRYHVPGACLALIRNSEVVWRGSYGVNDEPDRLPMPENAIFRLRAPVQLLALVAGVQQQNFGRMHLAEILRQGAELARSEYARNGERRDHRGQPPAIGVMPVAGRSGSQLPKGAPGQLAPNQPRLHTHAANGGAVYGYLRLAVELSSQQDLPGYCSQHIFQPFNMISAGFAPPAVDQLDRLALGHTMLGTPVSRPRAGGDQAPGDCLYASAQDMGRLVQAMLASPAGASSSVDPRFVDPIEEYSKAAALAPGGLPMAIRVDGTSVGRRVQLIDRTDGQGCLLRWYPGNRSGIAVMFNSATGDEAAERIAHLALGGE